MDAVEYLRILDAQLLGVPFNRPSPRIRSFIEGRDQSALNRSAMSELIRRFPERAVTLHAREGVMLTENARELFQADLDRIQSELETRPPDYYEFPKAPFAKDLGICLLRILPAGAEIVDLHSGIGRRILVSGSVTGLPSRCWFFLRRVRGFAPLYQFHVHSTSYPEFHEAGFTRFYLRVAEMMQLNPRVRGIFAESWFFDPALETISPRLNYLWQVPRWGGARLLRVGVSREHTENALMKSETRRRLHQEGRYQPTGYLLVWPRNELIRWASANKQSVTSTSP